MAPRPHDHTSQDPQDQILLSAALSGDDLAFTRALSAGADVNAVFEDGRNVVIGVMTGQTNGDSVDASNAPVMSISRLNILNAIITHQDISLFTLNSSSAIVCGVKSISPLGAAALLNKHTAVQTLLELSPGLVSVDLPDSKGRTPLMHACQNSGLEVVQHLLSHGARPDFRDAQFRTAVHYGLLHPRILWHCEDFLRRHRSGEITQHVNKRSICQAAQANALYHTKSPVIPPTHFYQDSHFVHTLIETISCGKSDAVQSLLFPPSSSQNPNPTSPDYLINAQDARGWSPIHYCVSSSSPTREILDALYLAGADISLPTAIDSHTPLHCIALTSCQPLDALDAGLLYSFTVHLVRDLRAPLGAQDRNGETCIHIAAERGASVDVLSALLDCDPKSIIREIRNSRGLTAAEVAKPEYRALFGLETERPDSAASVRTVRPKKSFKSLKSVPSLASIASVIPTYDHVPALPLDNLIPPSASILPLLDRLFDDLRFVSRALPATYDEAEFDALEELLADVVGMGNMLITLARDPVETVAGSLREAQSSVGRVSGLLNGVSKEVEDKLEIRTGAMMRWGESAIQARRRTTDSGSSGTTAVSQRSRTMSGSTMLGSSTDLSDACGEDFKERSAASGTEKLKKWLKKKLNAFTSPPSPAVVAQKIPAVRGEWEGARGLALRSSDRVLDAASRDLVGIEECMTMADQYIATGYHFLSKAETIFAQVVNSRRYAIQTGRERVRHSRMALDIQDIDLDPTLFTLPLPFPTVSTSPFGSPCPSSSSSPISGSHELPSVDGRISDVEDEQLLRNLKRLIARKVEFKVKGAQEEIETAHIWMRIVKDVVKGLRQTTDL